MSTFYADSSALVKRYVVEAGSAWVQNLCLPETGQVIALAQIGLVEIAAALGVKHRQGVLPQAQWDGLLHDLERDSLTQYFLIGLPPELIARAIALTRRQKVRGYDAVHLASALFLRDTLQQRQLPPPIFISADHELLHAAQAEGLVTDNPNSHL